MTVEWTWLTANWFSLLQTVSIVTGLVVVAKQQRQGRIQRESDSLVKILDNNRQLVSLAFANPKLFAILEDSKNTDPVSEQYYLQLWLNNFALTHTYIKRSVLRGEFRDNLQRDVYNFMTMENMQRHWQRFGKLYPASFQNFVNTIAKKDEPPAAAHVKSEAKPKKHHAAKT